MPKATGCHPIPHLSSAWVLFYLPPSTLHSMNSLDENTVNAPADDSFEVEVSVQRAASVWQLGVLTEQGPSSSLLWSPAPHEPLVSITLHPSTTLSSWEGRVSLPYTCVPTPSDHALLLQEVKMRPTDPSDKEVLVAALNLQEPTRTAYLNTTFTTTDL